MILCCEPNIVNQLEETVFTDQEAEDYVTMVLLGIITLDSLSLTYDFRVKAVLNRALEQGYGATLSSFPPQSPEYKLLDSLSDNIAHFTAAKQYQQVRDMSVFLGTTRDEFMREALTIFDQYNKSWLATEYETVINASQSGRAWVDFERNSEILPMLTYQTQQDGRVRPEHRILQGITRPVKDPFWDRYAPPNGWNCRCFLTSSVDAPRTPSKDIRWNTLENEVPELFQFNPGKTGMVFSKMHPYFDVKRGDAALRKNNYNLPV